MEKGGQMSCCSADSVAVAPIVTPPAAQYVPNKSVARKRDSDKTAAAKYTEIMKKAYEEQRARAILKDKQTKKLMDSHEAIDNLVMVRVQEKALVKAANTPKD